MDNVQLWISRYLDNELTDEDGEHLAKALARDGDCVDRLVYDGFIHSQLLDWMGQRQVPDRAASPEMAVSPAAARAPRVNLSKRSRLWSFGALAATLVIAATISLLAYTFVTRPGIVAQLTQATGSRWDASHAQIGAGALLREGQELKLLEGNALVTFSSGAQILLEAPVELRLDSAMQVHLRGGRIAAKVPTTARDFTVTSSLARFVDLGTAFTLKLAAEKSFELHVFEGLVELQLDKRFGEAVGHPLRVAEVHAVTFDVQSGDVAAIDFQEGRQMPF
jgi:FecR protein